MTEPILSLLVCPLTKQHLLPPSPSLTEALRLALDEQGLCYLDGSSVARLDGEALKFLVSENQQHIYSVIEGVPLLLESKQVVLST